MSKKRYQQNMITEIYTSSSSASRRYIEKVTNNVKMSENTLPKLSDDLSKGAQNIDIESQKKPIHKRKPLTKKQREQLEEKRASSIDKILKKSIAPLSVIFYFFFWQFVKPGLERIIPDKHPFLYNYWEKNEKIVFRLYISTSKSVHPWNANLSTLVAERKDFNYFVKWFRTPVLSKNYTFKITNEMLRNLTKYYWVFQASSNKCNFDEYENRNGQTCVISSWAAPIIRWEKNKIDITRNLAFDKRIDTVVDLNPHPYTYENATFDIVYHPDPLKETILEYQNYKYINLNNDERRFTNPVSECRYMHVRKHRTWLNESQEINITYHINVQLKRFYLWDYQLSMDVQPNDNMQKIVDDIKIASVDNPPWLFWGYVVLAFTRTIMKVIAFKEEIEWWSSLDNLKGVSAQAIIFELFSEFVIILYLHDENASFLDIVFKLLTLIMTCYKFFKLFTPIMDWPYFRWNGGDDPETRQFDAEAGKYLYRGLIPLLAGYTIYSLFTMKFKSWYSFLIKNCVNFVFSFGFLKMFPQVWVNYRLKSVAGISTRVLMYKLVTTFIDDIYAIVMNMPFLYRIACFRDDIVFFIWVYQCFIYKVDYNRVNEYGEILEIPEEEEEIVEKPAQKPSKFRLMLSKLWLKIRWSFGNKARTE